MVQSNPILSKKNIDEIRLKIENGYDQAIKNIFVFSESFIERSEDQKDLFVVVKAFWFMRRGGLRKYKVNIKSKGTVTSVTISSGFVYIKVAVVIASICLFFTFVPEPFFFTNYFPGSIFVLLGISIIFMQDVLERKRITTAIKKSINI